jgi:hypothetical protein
VIARPVSGYFMSEAEHNLRMLRLEWLTAQVLLALGVVIGIAGFFLPVSFRAGPSSTVSEPGTASVGPSKTAAGDQFCSSAVATARDFGVVPSDTRPAGMPDKTDVRGRYVCAAANGSGSFTVSIDLVCRDLGAERCFSLFNVTQSDGTVLYQRQD